MLFDVAALQYLYGENLESGSGDTIYILDETDFILAEEHMVGKGDFTNGVEMTSGSGVPLRIRYGIRDLTDPIPLQNLNPRDQNKADYGPFTTVTVYPIPEPTTLSLLGLALAFMAVMKNRKKI